MKTIEEIEGMIRAKRIDEAVAELERLLVARPDDAEARMLFGVCQQMKGETESFCEVYRELAPQLSAREAAGEVSPVVSRWRQYCKVAAYLVALGLVTFIGGNIKAAEVEGCSTNACSVVTTNVVGVTDAKFDVMNFKNLPRGVHNIKYDDKGVISTLVVVGKRAVPKPLRRNPGRVARYGGEGARDNAQLEFIRFLSTKCKWGKTADGETAVKEESASATDAQGNETSAESSLFTETEMTKEQKEQSALACVSGIQVFWEGMNDSGEYAWVGTWNAKALKPITTEYNEGGRLMTLYNMGGRPMTKYNMGGRPMTKYNMGGSFLDGAEDF